MPISTTLVMLRCPPRFGKPKLRAAIHTWPMISAALRSRWKPCLPVEQKLQSSAQPTCDDTQSVPRPSSGMKTV
jgi:hypothetical protein